jgi:hypothetical protein
VVSPTVGLGSSRRFRPGQVDGWLARKYNMGSVLGSILDPAADKLLMTTMVVTLTIQEMLPRPSVTPVCQFEQVG